MSTQFECSPSCAQWARSSNAHLLVRNEYIHAVRMLTLLCAMSSSSNAHLLVGNQYAVRMLVLGRQVVLRQQIRELLNERHDLAVPRHVLHRQAAGLRLAAVRHALTVNHKQQLRRVRHSKYMNEYVHCHQTGNSQTNALNTLQNIRI